MEQMVKTYEHCKNVHGTSDIMETVFSQQETLKKEVAKYCGERGVPTP